jgi:hypothetical protein
MASPPVRDQFESFVTALRDENAEQAGLDHNTLRTLISGELWDLSQGFH